MCTHAPNFTNKHTRYLSNSIACLFSVIIIVRMILGGHDIMAQNTDSLEQIVRRTPSVRHNTPSFIALLNTLSTAYLNTNTRRAMDYARQALSLSRSIAHTQGITSALSTIGLIYQYQEQNNNDSAHAYYARAYSVAHSASMFAEAAIALYYSANLYRIEGNLRSCLQMSTKALRLFEQVKLESGIVGAMNLIGVAYKDLGLYDSALTVYFQALRHSESKGDKESTAMFLNNIAIVFRFTENYTRALEYYQQALTINRSLGNQVDIADLLNNIGEVYGILQKTKESLDYHYQSLALSEKNNSKTGIANSLTNIALLLARQSNISTALAYYRRALRLRQEEGNQNAKVSLFNDIASLYQQQQQWDSAYIYRKAALELSDSTKSLPLRKTILQGLFSLFREQGDYKSSLAYYEQYLQAKDSLFTLESNKKMNELQVQYDAEKKQQQIQLLEKDKLLKMSEIRRQQIDLYRVELLQNKQKQDIVLLSKEKDLERAETQRLQLENIYQQSEVETQKLQRNALVAFLVFATFLLIALVSLNRKKESANKEIQRQKIEIEEERFKSESLLLNILPFTIAYRIKLGETSIAEHYSSVCVLFSDVVGFTDLSQTISPQELVAILDRIFTAFDNIAEELKLEKIKTIGDAYMVVGGVPEVMADSAFRVVAMALRMRTALTQLNSKYSTNLQIRIGLHTGEVVAGVIGKKKFAYDLWGDTVNIASRMESYGLPGEIHISRAVYDIIKDSYTCVPRGMIDIKGKGLMETWFVEPSTDLKQLE
jgi:adenylate cyclase